MMKRFDYRSKDKFIKDIEFSTKLEKYFFNEWVRLSDGKSHIKIYNPRDHGCDNDGKFVERPKSTADYMVDLIYRGKIYRDLPLEIKWTPTYGKFTLKEDNLISYIDHEASILFIYNSVKLSIDLRKPADYDFDKHIKKIESISNQLRWCIVNHNSLRKMLSHYEVKPVHYMGGKLAIVVDQSDITKWGKEENWK